MMKISFFCLFIIFFCVKSFANRTVFAPDMRVGASSYGINLTDANRINLYAGNIANANFACTLSVEITNIQTVSQTVTTSPNNFHFTTNIIPASMPIETKTYPWNVIQARLGSSKDVTLNIGPNESKHVFWVLYATFSRAATSDVGTAFIPNPNPYLPNQVSGWNLQAKGSVKISVAQANGAIVASQNIYCVLVNVSTETAGYEQFQILGGRPF